MRSSILFSVLLVLFAGADCFLKPFKAHQYPLEKGANPGKALILTPLIKAGKIAQAQKKSTVTPLIGNVTSYSGYLTTNEKCGNNLFFWFFPAQMDWENAPLVLWLQGGPGSPSMFGLFEENGPFSSFKDGLQMRDYPWNVRNNLLYIDQPAGTGYSFTKNKCYAENETVIGEEMHSAITQFLTLFPNLQQNKFFITGESYGGHYIPSIGYTILKKNPTASLKINLVGLMIGDGWTDPREQINYADYLYQIGLIDNEQRENMYIYQNQFISQVDNEQWSDAFSSWSKILGLYNTYAGTGEYNYLPLPADNSNWEKFIQKTATRKAIHVGPQKFSEQSIAVYNHLLQDLPKSVKPYVQEVLEEIPIVFYAGQVDVICAYPMIINFIRTLNWTGQDTYLKASRRIWYEGQDIAGYVRGEYRLFDVLVRDAGHMVPQDQPYWAFQLINSFVWGEGIFNGKV